MEHRFKDAVLGGVLGGAVGDALGMPFEGLPSKSIAEKYHRIDYYLPGRKGTPLQTLRPGQYTDDTQLVVATLNAFQQGYSIARLVHEFKLLFPNIRGAGKSTYTALNNLVNDCSPKKSGDLLGIGCGAITRVFPFVALRYGDDDITACENEIASAVQITHNNKTATSAALITSGILEKLVELDANYFNRKKNRLDFISKIIECPMNETPELKQLQRNLMNVKNILQNKRPNILDLREKLGSTGKIMELLPSSLCFFLLSSESYLSSVSDAIMLGGDTDSRAALTGIFSGVYLGKSKIPEYLLTGLEKHSELERLASDLASSIERRFSGISRYRRSN